MTPETRAELVAMAGSDHAKAMVVVNALLDEVGYLTDWITEAEANADKRVQEAQSAQAITEIRGRERFVKEVTNEIRLATLKEAAGMLCSFCDRNDPIEMNDLGFVMHKEGNGGMLYCNVEPITRAILAEEGGR